MARWALIIFLFLATILSFVFVYNSPSVPQPYYLAIASLVLFSLSYALEVLNYRIGGKHISIEKRLDDLQSEQTELKEITNALLKIALIHQDGAGRFGGTPQEHKELIAQHVSTLSKYVEKGFNENLKKDISKLNQQIKERTAAK